MNFRLQVIDGYLWLYYQFGGHQLFRLLIGAGGALSQVIDSGGRQLLSPSFAGETTDRTVQWTLWSNSLTHPVPGLPKFEHRYNLTQGGTMTGLCSPVTAVDYQFQPDRLDIWARPTLNWKEQLQRHFTGGVNCLTRYTPVSYTSPSTSQPVSFLEIRRLLLVNPIKHDGHPAQLGSCYLEAWTPFNHPVYTDVVVSCNLDSGEPLWWYQAQTNLPFYPRVKPGETRGYVVVTSSGPTHSIYGRTAAILIFGKQNPTIRSSTKDEEQQDQQVLNFMGWNNGLGVLPGLEIEQLEPGDLVDVTYQIFFTGHLERSHLEAAQELADRLRAPAHYKNSWLECGGDPYSAPDYQSPDEEILTIYHKLKNNNKNGQATDRLGQFLQRGGNLGSPITAEPFGIEDPLPPPLLRHFKSYLRGGGHGCGEPRFPLWM